MKRLSIIAPSIVALMAMAAWAPTSQAYPTYSETKRTDSAGDVSSVGYCQTCHKDFRDEETVQLSDGEPWEVLYQEVGNPPPAVLERGLHDVHRHVMVDRLGSSRCNVCHTRPPGFYPVILGSSTGSEPLLGLGCVGCHGRAEDAGHDAISAGLGAGLRQHHTTAGISVCAGCHTDADPAKFKPAGEDVFPPHYAAGGDVFVNLPTDPCNRDGEEDYAGGPDGLDNDGDGRYDKNDSDCRRGGGHYR